MNLTQSAFSMVLLAGDFTLFVGRTLRATRKIFRRFGLFLQQCEIIGVRSIGVIFLASISMGAVLGYQFYVGFHWLGAEELLGGSVGVSLYRDLASMMTAIMVAGRAGSAIAAEISTMRITEQVDAMEVMSVDPVEYLVVPRVWAGTIMTPLLCVVFAAVASVAAAGVACGIMDLSWATYWDLYAKYADPMDLVHCVTKGAAFGMVLTWVAAFFGFRAQGGARAVGDATRKTVVFALLAILVVDYILTSLLPFGDANFKL